MIDMFDKENTDRFKRLGIPKTFGMLMYGEPGTGKTSTIKAIAHYTQRNVIIVPVNWIKTAQQLRNLFSSQRINASLIPMDKRLYVFEEIDCGDWRDIVMSRELKKEFTQDKKQETDEMKALSHCIKTGRSQTT
jgi:hypothetical protein